VQFLVCDEWSVTQDATELDVSGKDLQAADVALLRGVISNNGTLRSLNLSSNNLKVEGVKIVAEAIKVPHCVVAIILVPFSCISDLSFNCCCLPISTG
jgi:hypothetical protein